jgi:hypothetical protein
MQPEILIGVAVAIIGYQLFVTARVIFRGQYTAVQRAFQVALIWFVPLFGAVICHVFIDSDSAASRPRDTSFTRDGGDNPPGIGQGGHE